MPPSSLPAPRLPAPRLPAPRLPAPRLLVALLAALTTVAALIAAPIPASASVATPSKISTVTAVAGPLAGELTFTWKQDGKNTTSYELETALSLFSKSTSSSLPREGRHRRVFSIGPSRRSLTLTADQVREAGAGVGSGAHLLFRFAAINRLSAGETIRRYPYLQAIQPELDAGVAGVAGADAEAEAEADSSITLRVASFNVRTAKATSDARPWLKRRADVAEQIYARHPDIVTLQEIGPGRADGQSGSTTGTMRQTTSLLDSLAHLDAQNYKMVRTTPYVAPGVTHGSQGTRMIYDNDKVLLVSDCPEATGKSNYSPSCSIELPILSGESESNRRSVAYAKFADRDTHRQFYVVSAHLDYRHSTSKTKEAVYNALRGRQMQAIFDELDKINTSHLPVILGGDLNSYQNLTVGDAPHEALYEEGFIDSASARLRANIQYSTYNGFATTQTASGMGYGSRLDGIFIQGGYGKTFENVTKVKDSARPSDHNMVLSTVVLNY